MEKQNDSDHIPDDILINILTNLPTKSLCRSKSLSESYNSLIKSPNFIHKFRQKIPHQWTNLPPKQYLYPNNNEITELQIYEIQNNEVSTTVQTYKPPPGTFFLRQYKGLICSYSESSQLTLFNTITQDSKTVYFPVIDEYIKDPYRNFEYGYDPLSKKFKVFTYRFESLMQLWKGYWKENPMCGPLSGKDCVVEETRNFEVFTLGEESSNTWRPVKQTFSINSFSECATIVGERLFWFDYYVDEYCDPIIDDGNYEVEPPQIVSFNFTKEELTKIEIPGEKIIFKYDPLFEFEGCLCFVEAMASPLEQYFFWELNPLEQDFYWELNVWTLKDIDSSHWMMMKRISLPLEGTNLRTTRLKNYPIMKETVEFSVQNDEILIAVFDDINQYVFAYNFLNEECKRMKIVGEPLCKKMKMVQSQCQDNGTDSDDDLFDIFG